MAKVTKRKPAEEAEPAPPSYGDGRHPILTYSGLFPSQEALTLGEAAASAAHQFFITAKFPMTGNTPELGSELAQIANGYIRLKRFAVLPSAEEYRNHAKQVKSLAEDLLKVLRDAPEESFAIDMSFRSKQPSSLGDTPRALRESLFGILSPLMQACNDVIAVRSSTALRPRNDLRIAAAQLAVLWERLTERRFTTNLVRNEDKGEWDFQADGPRFVHRISKVFDPSITPSEIATALRKRAARKPL